MRTDPNIYQSYLLRLFRERPDTTWRAVLHNVVTDERRSFADLESLFVYLCARTGHPFPSIEQDSLTRVNE